jgi:hypothetical protein
VEATLAGAVKQSEEHAKQVEAALARKLMASHKTVEVSYPRAYRLISLYSI